MAAEEGASGRPVVLLVLDAAPEVGVGHAIRCQALAEEILSRGLAVRQLGRMEVGWVTAAYRALGIGLLGVGSLLDAAARPEVVAVVVDSYTLPAASTRALAGLGKPVLAIVDDTTRDLSADLFLEQNLGSSPTSLGMEPATALCGPEFALLRDVVLARRHRAWQPTDTGDHVEVAVLFGGTDPAHGAHRVARALAATGVPLVATIMAATPAHRAELEGVGWAADQAARLLEPSPDFVTAVAEADLVISAGGTTVYELMALGRPSAICTVAENQRRNYDQLVGRGLALGLDRLDDLDAQSAATVAGLARLIGDDRARAEVAAAGFRTVDGAGRRRVVDIFLRLSGFEPAG